MQGEMSQGRNVAQGEMSLREKCRREKSRREKCRREKCLSGRNVVQSIIATAVTYIILAFATADGDNTTTCEISFLFQKNDILMANSLAQVFPKIFPAASTSSSSLPSGQFFHT